MVVNLLSFPKLMILAGNDNAVGKKKKILTFVTGLR